MKTNIKSKKFLIILTFMIVLLVGCVGLFNRSNDNKLTESQIAALRKQYPICGIKMPEVISFKKFTMEEVKNLSETFVYGEVIGEPSTYEVTISTGNDALDDKRNANGISEKYDFYEYEVLVIDDSESIYSNGDIITIAANTDFKEYLPQLSNGMRIVVPVAKDDEKEGRNHYTVEGMYYVTQDEYVISAFDENVVSPRGAMSGVKVDTLLNTLKK